jgi:hypothetical protein
MATDHLELVRAPSRERVEEHGERLSALVEPVPGDVRAWPRVGPSGLEQPEEGSGRQSQDLLECLYGRLGVVPRRNSPAGLPVTQARDADANTLPGQVPLQTLQR